MKTRWSFSLITSILCSLAAPQMAAADASSYWAAIGTPSPAPSSLYPRMAAPYTCTTNYYVSTSGGDSSSGTSGAPWRTLSHAVSVLANRGSLAGVCVNVAPGTYSESLYLYGLNGNADAPTGYLVFRSTTPRAAILYEPANARGAVVTIDHSQFVIFDSFEIRGRATSDTAGFFIMNSHHIRAIDSTVHDLGGAGIAAIFSDYVFVQDNVVYNTSCCDSSAVSGIDLWAPIASDKNPGFHNQIKRNIVFNADDKLHRSEGHGIILDNFRANGYTAQTLIEGNLVYHNGGAGIILWYADNTTIRNNTAFDNYRDDQYPAGEITVINSSHTVVVNNIAVPNITTDKTITGLFDQTWDGTNTGNVWSNNLAFDGNPGDKVATNYSYCACGVNTRGAAILGVDPLFVNPAAGDFRLQAGSPAIGAGTSTYGMPYLDLAEKPWTSPPGIGAYQFK